MKNALVTGAAGYLGAKISLHLKELGYNVYALCRSLPNDINNSFKGIEMIKGDVTVPETLDLLMSKPIDVVVHTVSLDHNLSEMATIEQVNKTNVLATWQLLDTFSKKKIEKFIFLSTMQVLGKLPIQTISENNIKTPDNIYGLTHSFGEDLINYYNQKSETSCISFRLSNGYGAPVFSENNCWWLVINDLCRSAYYYKKITLNSDGTPYRDFIHIKDIARSVGFILNQEYIANSLFHISSGRTYSLLEIAHKIKLVYEQRYQILIAVYHSGSILSESIPEFTPRYTISNERLLKPGFYPEVSLENGIEELFDYFENLNNNGTRN